MYKQIYSTVEDFIKVVTQDKKFSFSSYKLEWKTRSEKKTVAYTGHFTESFKIYNSYKRLEGFSSDCKNDGFDSRYAELRELSESFKLHGVCSEKGFLESVIFTSGNVNDSKMVEKVTENLNGKFFCDAGYLKKSRELIKLAKSGRFIYAATRQNMNRLMSHEQWEHLRKRNIIESDWGVLKQNFFLEYHQARSMDGLFRHYVSCISAYILDCRLKSYTKIKTRI